MSPGRATVTPTAAMATFMAPGSFFTVVHLSIGGLVLDGLVFGRWLWVKKGLLSIYIYI